MQRPTWRSTGTGSCAEAGGAAGKLLAGELAGSWGRDCGTAGELACPTPLLHAQHALPCPASHGLLPARPYPRRTALSAVWDAKSRAEEASADAAALAAAAERRAAQYKRETTGMATGG